MNLNICLHWGKINAELAGYTKWKIFFLFQILNYKLEIIGQIFPVRYFTKFDFIQGFKKTVILFVFKPILLFAAQFLLLAINTLAYLQGAWSNTRDLYYKTF